MHLMRFNVIQAALFCLGVVHLCDCRQHSTVCIAGNAENATIAKKTFQMWDSKFPSCWFTWGEHDAVQNETSIFFIRSHEPRTWAQGMHAAVSCLENHFECDYFFTHDDDLVFHISPAFESKYGSWRKSDVLESILTDDYPAVASFPWQVAQEKYPNLKAIAESYRAEIVAPLTAFDNGMVIYHRSVVNLFVPYAPSGEGGFIGEWTLVAHFLMMFGSLTFPGHALCINALNYSNTVNPDNQPGKVVISEDGKTASWGNSRHVYEFPQNDAYISFLESGLKRFNQRWGRKCKLSDLPSVKVGGPDGYSPSTILSSINSFFDVRHPALVNNRLFNTQLSETAIASVVHQNHFTIKLVLFTYNRLRSFQRLWQSIESALPVTESGISVSIVVVKDYDAKATLSEREQYSTFLKSLKSKHGEVVLLETTERRGLKYNILNSWQPQTTDEYAVLLEDDIEVSKYFLDYVSHYVRFYFYGPELHPLLFGISLYSIGYSEVKEEFVTIDNGYKPYAYQQPQSWGGLYAARPWRQFVDFVADTDKEGLDPIIPDSYTNRWSPQKSWKKYLYRFMYAKGYFMIYPNMPQNLSFSTNNLEVGANIPKDAKENLVHKLSRPLLDMETSDAYRLYRNPPAINELEARDIYHDRADSVNDFPDLPTRKPVESFDQCTLVFQVYSRIDFVAERIKHYSDLKGLAGIVVLVNKQGVKTPDIEHLGVKVPVHILQMPKNSLNNRFYPWPEITTDCIFTVDDDFDLPHEHLLYAIKLWKGHFWNHLVGFIHQARNHAEVDGKLYYAPQPLYPQQLNGRKPFFSIVLPTGMVYHRKWMYEYTFNTPKHILDKVEADINGEDILLNMVVANKTGNGPVVINAFASAIKELGLDAGLWTSDNWYAKRTEFTRAAAAAFGGSPLKYTLSLFNINWGFFPGLHHMFYRDDIPWDFQCNSARLKEEDACLFDI